MRCISVGFCLATVLVGGLLPVRAEAESVSRGTVLRVQATDASGTHEGTCFVVHQEPRNGRTVVYFLTSARLFAARGASFRARVVVDGPRGIDIAAADILVPAGLQDLAILRAVVTDSAFVAFPVHYVEPGVDSVFLIAGQDAAGTRLFATQQTRSTALGTTGDRPLDALSGCPGAPAITERGVFGLVRECAPGLPPAIVPLSASRDFISREIPGFVASPADDPQFVLTAREVTGPLLQVAAGQVREGEVDVPLNLAPGEALVSATARLVDRQSLRSADVTVLSLADRAVKLRFTLGGASPPPQTASWPQGQALVAVRINVITVPTP
jgi:hypothetical protein